MTKKFKYLDHKTTPPVVVAVIEADGILQADAILLAKHVVNPVTAKGIACEIFNKALI